jgi:glutathione S-transferase
MSTPEMETIMSQVEVFGFAGSTYVRTALAAAAEKGIACVLKPLEFRAERHLRLHPFAKMPAMLHGVLRLYETAAITAYFDEAFEGPALQPSAPIERAAMWQWVSAANAYFYPAFVHAELAEDGGGPGADEARERALCVLDEALAERRFLVGDSLTLADLFAVPMVAFMAEKRGGAEKALAGRMAIRRWLEGATRRAGFGGLVAA